MGNNQSKLAVANAIPTDNDSFIDSVIELTKSNGFIQAYEKIKELIDQNKELKDHLATEVCQNISRAKEIDELKKQNKAMDWNQPFNYAADYNEWVWGHGYKQTDTEYVIHISGGGDPSCPNGFEDWVIKNNSDNELQYYIRYGGIIPDKIQNKIIVTCPDGNYVSWQEIDYELREGEMDYEWLEEELETFEDEE